MKKQEPHFGAIIGGYDSSCASLSAKEWMISSKSPSNTLLKTWITYEGSYILFDLLILSPQTVFYEMASGIPDVRSGV